MVVVVVVVVTVVELVVVELAVAILAASNSFSIEIGVVDGVGQPVNSVVALKIYFLAYYLLNTKISM